MKGDSETLVCYFSSTCSAQSRVILSTHTSSSPCPFVRRYNFQGWVLWSDWAATNTSFEQDATNVTGFAHLNRTAGGRRLDTEVETEPTATTTTTKRKKTNALGRGLTRFCRKIGIKPEYLFLSTLAFFSVLLAVVLLLSSALWAADRCMKMRRRAVSGGRPGGSAVLPAKDASIPFVTLLGWRLQGLTLRACYHGFYAVSSSAVFQVFLQASAPTPTPTTTPTTTSSSRVVPAANATLASTAVAVLAILVFFLIIFVGGALALRTSNVNEPRTRVLVGTLVVQYKPSHRLFWMVRPAQILVTALAMALMSAAPTAQVAVLIAVHALSLIAVVVFRPFNDKVHFLVAVAVEVMRLVCCALLLAVLEAPSLGVELASILLNTATIFLLCAVECVNVCGAMRRRLRDRSMQWKSKLGGKGGGEDIEMAAAGVGGGDVSVSSPENSLDGFVGSSSSSPQQVRYHG